jgi:hypothetical protein
VVLAVAMAVLLTSFYANATHRHVDVVFHQEGLGTGGVLQIDINCVGVYSSGTPPVSGVIDLGWLNADDFITVQARAGAASPYLSFHMVVNGRSESTYSTPGQPGNPVGLGSTTLVGTWLLHLSFPSSGKEAVNGSCPGPVGATFASTGSEPPTDMNWSKTFDWLFTGATAAAPTVVQLYYGMGVVLLFLAVVWQAVAARRDAGLLRAVLFGFLALVIGLATLTGSLQELWLRDVTASLTALATGVLGMRWLCFGIFTWAASLKRDRDGFGGPTVL